MFKYIRYVLTILGVLFPLVTQAVLPDNANKFSFTAIPTFNNMCIRTVQSGTYTIRNNSSVAWPLVNVQIYKISSSDTLPDEALIYVPTSNDCAPYIRSGTPLPPGASCNFQVKLQPQTYGIINRGIAFFTWDDGPIWNRRVIPFSSPPINIAANCTITHTIRTAINVTKNSSNANKLNAIHGSLTPWGNVTVEDGSNQTFQITPDPHYHIDAVFADEQPAGAVPSFTFYNVKNDHTIRAVFGSDMIIQASVVKHGAITPSGNVIVDYGADQQFILKPDDSYQIDNVLVDGQPVGVVSTYTFPSVIKEHSIVGIFAPMHLLTARPSAVIYTDVGEADAQNKVVIIHNGNNTAATDISYSLDDSLHNVPMPSGTCKTIAPHNDCTLNFLAVGKDAYGNGNLNLQYKIDGSSKSYVSPVRIAVNNAVLVLQDQSGKEVAKIEFPKNQTFPATQTFSIHNTGKFILQTAHLGLSDSHDDNFSIINDSCSGNKLSLGDACTFSLKVSEKPKSEANTSNLIIVGGNIPTTTIPIEVGGALTIAPDISDAKRHLAYRAIYLHNTTGNAVTIKSPTLSGDITDGRVKYCAFGDSTCSYQSCDITKPLDDGGECWLWFHALDNSSDNLSHKSGTVTIGIDAAIPVTKTFSINYDKSLYLGGSFTKTTDGVTLNHFAKYDGRAFQGLGITLNAIKKGWWFKDNTSSQGLNNAVNAFAIAPDGDLYLGGDFTANFDNTATMYHVARYDGSQLQGLLPINAGVDDSVYSLAFSPIDHSLYLGGSFKASLNNVILNHIARYSTNTFTPLQNGLDSGNVLTMVFTPNGDLYLGGDFQQSNNLIVHRVAKYNAKDGFTALGGSGLDGLVNAIAYSAAEQKVYFGGVFLKTKDDGATLNHITKYNIATDTFELLGNTYAPGLSNDVMSLVVSPIDSGIYIGGDFINARDGSVLHRITKYISDKFQSMLPGIYRFGADITHINALTFDSQNNLYLGGDFTVIDDNSNKSLNGIAQYNLDTKIYQILGVGIDVTASAVNALVVAPSLIISE